MKKFRVFRVYRNDQKITGRIEDSTLDELSAGEVVIKSEYSSVNYKDALAATGAGKIISKFPLIGGIDVSGIVKNSEDDRFKSGDKVLVTGYEMGMSHDGGYAEYVRVPAEWVIPLPESITTKEAMIIGTAGFTAALCIDRMEQNGQTPEQGTILINGASGGVGCMAIDMFSSTGYDVTALTGKMSEIDYLRSLGAKEVLDRNELSFSGRPLETSLWAGAVDNVGGAILSWLTKTVHPWGNIASVGLAASAQLETTVLPFILRGVSLLGITSAGCPTALRHKIWNRIGSDLRPQHFDQIALQEVVLEELNEVFSAMLNGQTKGRTIVRL
ncbi:MAG: oxidoreductase [Gammaproteobacteria bacterium]